MLSEFVPLPSRLTSSPLYSSPSRFDDVSMLTHSRSPRPSAAAELTQDDVIITRKHYAAYYNSWESNESKDTGGHARQVTHVDAAGLDGLHSLSANDGGSATEDSGSVLSSSSYEHLDTQCADTNELVEQRCGSTSPAALNESLVSVTPDVDSLSTTSTSSSPVSDMDDSLSDAVSLYNNEDVWYRTRTRFHSADGNDLGRQGDGDDKLDDHQGLCDDARRKDADCHTFDGKEIATIRMLELELLAADLSKQMSSMHRLMRLLSCETSQLASIIDDERRHGVPAAIRRQRRGVGGLAEFSSDNDEFAHDAKMAVAGKGEAGVSTQKVLLSAVIDELKSVSVMMSNTLQSVSASRSPSSSTLTAQDGAVRNNMTEPDDFYQLYIRTADNHDENITCLSAAATDDDDDDDDDYDDDDRNDDTCSTEVSATCFSVNSFSVKLF